jgi:type 1 glutamine amidotransferase
MRGCLIALAVCLPFACGADAVRVQITTGGHPFHPSFYDVFAGQTELALTANPHPSAFRRDLRKFADVLVLYDLNDVTGDAERRNLQAYVESGRGVVILHHALADNWQWKWWYEEVAGGRFLMGNDGDLARSTAKAGEVVNARPVARHPVMEGVGELRFEDEVYKGMWISPKSHVLMHTDNPNNDRAVVWIGPHAKARVVFIQFGHGPGVYSDAGYRKLVRNAIFWAAGRTE